MSVIGCVAIYDLLRQCELSSRAACLGAAALIANPLYLYLEATSFMSDIFYFSAHGASASASTFRGLRRDSAPGTHRRARRSRQVAYLARQLAIALPISVVFMLLLRNRRLRWPPLVQAALLPGLVFAGHSLWLKYVHGTPWGLELNTVHNKHRGLTACCNRQSHIEIVWRLLISMLYMGLFTLPVLAALVASRPKQVQRLTGSRSPPASLSGWTAVVALSAYVTHGPMPYLGNVINRVGLGPIGLAGQKPVVTPTWVFWLVTACAPVTAGAVQGAIWTDALLRASQAGLRPAGAGDCERA